MFKVERWLIRPVFISSTFRDMHAERDYLRQHVFPILEERLRERQHHLEPIDLRWGIETVSAEDIHAKEQLVLKVCLGEIERSRPFVIVLLGDRYGWVPPKERMDAATQEIGFQTETNNKSVTALEIEFGVLESPEQRCRSFFYFRESLPYEEMSPETAAIYSDAHATSPSIPETVARLRQLKERIELAMPDRVRRYRAKWDRQRQMVTGLEEWGHQVIEDLWSELQIATADWVDLQPKTWQDHERLNLEEFIESRGHFIGRVEFVNRLIALAESPDDAVVTWGSAVTGEPGSGKSSLFAQLYSQLQDRPLFLLAHAAGISPQANEPDTMLRRWVKELADQLGAEDPLSDQSSAEDIEATFASLLSRASKRQRVVILIDALDQFEPTVRAQYLTWLPRVWPANARLITTSIRGIESSALLGRQGVEHIPLTPLNTDEAEEMARAICWRYHRQLHPDVLGILMDKRSDNDLLAAGNPLWLELALQELNLLDADDFARAERDYVGAGEEKLHQMICDVARSLPAIVADLYTWTLDRAEEVYGRDRPRSFVSLVALSRTGWRESDLAALYPVITGEDWTDADFAVLRRAFRTHLVQRGKSGQWDFTHPQMRQAIYARNLQEISMTRKLHEAIADHLESLPSTDPLRQTELIHHMVCADNRLRTARHYAALPIESVECDAASRTLADYILSSAQELTSSMAWVTSLLDLPDLSALEVYFLCNKYQFNLLVALDNDAQLSTRIELIEATCTRFEQLCRSEANSISWRCDLAGSYKHLGNMLRAQGDTSGAISACRKSLGIMKRLCESDPTRAIWQNNLAVGQIDFGNMLADQGSTEGASEAYRAALDIRQRLCELHPHNSSWKYGLMVGHVMVGGMLSMQGDAERALEQYQAAIAIVQSLCDSDPTNVGWQREMSIIHGRIGSVHFWVGTNADEALEAYRASMVIIERLCDSDPSNAGWQRDLANCQTNLGHVLLAQGNTSEAIGFFRASLAIMQNLCELDSSNTDWQSIVAVCHDLVADALKIQGDAESALASYLQSLAIRQRFGDLDPTHTWWQRDIAISHERIGDLLLWQRRDFDGALEAFRGSLKIREQLCHLDRSNTGWQRDLADCQRRLGHVLLAQGDASEALGFLKEALAIIQHLCEMEPTNSYWQSFVAVCHVLMGDARKFLGDPQAALASYHLSLAIRQRFSEMYPNNTVWQIDVAISQERIGVLLFQQRGDFAVAVEAYRASLNTRERLCKLDPSNTGWQCDLANCQWKLGELLLTQGDANEAMRSVRASLAIIQNLCDLDPSNADWQSQAGNIHVVMADAFKAQGNAEEALACYQQSLTIRQKFGDLQPTNTVWQREIVISKERIGDLLYRELGDIRAALEAYRTALDIRKRLCELQPSNTDWRHELASRSGSLAVLIEQVENQ